MESRYGVGINNRYALFIQEDDVDDEALLKKAAENAANIKKDKVKQKVNGVPAPAPKKDVKAAAPAPAPAPSAQTKKPEPGKQPRGEDKENRGSRFEGKRVLDARKTQDGPREPRTREERNNRRNRPNEDESSGQAPVGFGSEPKRTGEGRRGGRGAGRGGDRPRGGGRGGKREFERKSGDDKTGVKSVDKREGGGSHNWGTFEDEIKAEDDKVNTSTDEVTETPVVEGEAPPAESGGEEAKESDEPKVMTLDEYKKQLGERSGPKFNLRKPGEGTEIDPKWKKTTAYKKEKEFQDEEDEEQEHELYPQRVNRQKRVMDIEISFGETGRGGGPVGGRGGRGGPRGGRRGGNRGPPREGGGERREEGARKSAGKGRSRNEAPNVNDELSFPSLG